MAPLRSGRSFDASRSTPTVVRFTSYRSEPALLAPPAARQAQSGGHKTPHRHFPLVQSLPAVNHREDAKDHKQGNSSLLSLTLPLPPSINHQYATVQGRRVLSSAGRRFKHQVGQEMLCVLAKRRGHRSLAQALDGLPLALDLRFYFVSALRRDIDGGLKITQDAVCEALGINDNRIVEVLLRKEIDHGTPRMELALRIAE